MLPNTEQKAVNIARGQLRVLLQIKPSTSGLMPPVVSFDYSPWHYVIAVDSFPGPPSSSRAILERRGPSAENRDLQNVGTSALKLVLSIIALKDYFLASPSAMYYFPTASPGSWKPFDDRSIWCGS
jgi:hypothetical protein